MKLKKITPKQIKRIDFLTQTNEQLDKLAQRIANNNLENKHKLFDALISVTKLDNGSGFSKKSISKLSQKELDEFLEKQKVNCNLQKIVRNPLILKDFVKFKKELLEILE